MARALWTGSLSFGLVNVPVALVTSVRDLDLHFRQLHEKDGAPIEVQRWCSKENEEVPFEEITHGYELEDGGQVIISDLELEALSRGGRAPSTSSGSSIWKKSTPSTSITRTSWCRHRKTMARSGLTGY